MKIVFKRVKSNIILVLNVFDDNERRDFNYFKITLKLCGNKVHSFSHFLLYINTFPFFVATNDNYKANHHA